MKFIRKKKLANDREIRNIFERSVWFLKFLCQAITKDEVKISFWAATGENCMSEGIPAVFFFLSRGFFSYLD